jgi:hypothetical protein
VLFAAAEVLLELCRNPWTHTHVHPRWITVYAEVDIGEASVQIVVALLFVLAATTAARAEAWTCSYVLEGFKEAFLHRFLILGNELVEAKTNDRYRLLQNNEYGLVATYAISEIEEGQKKPTVGVIAIIINKTTGEFMWENAILGYDPSLNSLKLDTPVKGKCIKD